MQTLLSALEPPASPGLPTGAPSRAAFADIDEQAAALIGWNQRYQQLSCGPFRGAVQRLQLDGVGLFIEDMQQAVHQTGRVHPAVVALGVPLMLQGESRFCGRAGSESALHVFSGDEGFEFRSPQCHVMLGIEVDAALFETHVIGALHGEADHLAARAHLRAGDSVAIGRLRRFLVELFDQSARCGAAPQAGGSDGRVPVQAAGGAFDVTQIALRDALLERLAGALRRSDATDAADAPDSARAGGSQSRLAERARALVASRLDQPPSVAELCGLLGVSRRTLQSCVQTSWGMGPLAWLNTMRLNAVRRELKRAGSVTEAATQFGFWHFGHFADDYRALFGELPSQTLRRHRGVTGPAPH